MKRFFLLAVLLSLSTFSIADTIKLTSGSGTMYPFDVAPGFTFQFSGSGYNLSIPGALDDPGGSLWNCVGCDPTILIQPFFIFGGNLTTGDPYLSGLVSFNAVSFVSSLGPGGILTIRYKATISIQLDLIDPTTGFPVAGEFVWGSPDPWYITAKFHPDLPSTAYTQMGATFISSPEPATSVLLGTGLAVIVWRKYRAANA
ncbi:MAG TPA: PEP-CTERM sorting domain-containing protein [Terriglobales bacterium]|nr:PEP-CTERM sorting domain-containing protein [Terriglobales bacterium]